MSNDITASGSPDATLPASASAASAGGALPAMVHCTTCGQQIATSAQACPKCGAPNAVATPKTSVKGMVPAALLCFFGFGIHRFYVGKIGTGILMILTFGGLGIWTIIDFVMIIVGSFKDKQGLPLRR